MGTFQKRNRIELHLALTCGGPWKRRLCSSYEELTRISGPRRQWQKSVEKQSMQEIEERSSISHLWYLAAQKSVQRLLSIRLRRTSIVSSFLFTRFCYACRVEWTCNEIYISFASFAYAASWVFMMHHANLRCIMSLDDSSRAITMHRQHPQRLELVVWCGVWVCQGGWERT